MDGKIVVYTALTGNRDFLKDEQQKGKADFICYSDKKLESDTWEIRPTCDLFVDNNRNAKIHKVLAHQFLDYDYSIWIDGSVIIKTDPEIIVEKYLKNHDMAVFKHREKRDCIYKEFEICYKKNLDDRDLMKEQIDHYKAIGYPEDSGLFECGVLIRKHNKRVEDFNNMWWGEISRYSKRDQLSFCYCLSKSKVKVRSMDGDFSNNDNFTLVMRSKNPIKPKPIKKLFIGGDIKVVMNCSTSFGNQALSAGDMVQVQGKVAQRWVSRGLAHYFNTESLLKSGKSNKKTKFTRHPKVSIVVLVRNELDYIKKCFDSINKCTADYELIVINNGGGKKTKDYLRSLKKFNLTVITNKENMGFSYGCNQGIKVAKHEYICFLNSDTIVTPRWLDKLMAPFKVYKDCGMVGPSTSYCGSLQSIGTLSAQRHKVSVKEINKIAESLPEGIIKYDSLQGFCMVIKKEILDKGGVFNYKRFKLGCTEEIELLWRLRLLNRCSSYWVKDSYVHHFGHVVFNELGIDVNKYNKEERLKWFNSRDKEGPQFIKNDVKIDNKYVERSKK